MQQALQVLAMLAQRSMRCATGGSTPAAWHLYSTLQQVVGPADVLLTGHASTSVLQSKQHNAQHIQSPVKIFRQFSTVQQQTSNLPGTGPITMAQLQSKQQQQEEHQNAVGQQDSRQQTPVSQAPNLPPELLNILSQPLPLGSTVHRSLNSLVVHMNDCYFLDPRATLQSTLRAFLVIRQVLRSNGHVCVVNTNPSFTPLMQHAARHCTNPNMWWHWKEYQPGMLLRHPAHMLSEAAQPARKVLQRNGLSMVNVHCPRPGVMDQPTPKLDILDKWRLWNTPRTTQSGLRGRQLLQQVMVDEIQSAQLLLPGAGNQQFAPTLIVLLDLSYGEELLADAHEAGILTASVVNAHSGLERISYPIYAAEAHPAYTHFFLDWLLKVVNLPTTSTSSRGV